MERFAESFKRDHLLSRMDARVKLLVTLILLLMVISHRGFILPGLITLLCLVTILHMKIPFRAFLLRLSEPVLISFVIVILKCFFSGREPLFSIELIGFTLSGYRDGLMEGLRIVSRVLSAVSIVGLLGFSTSFGELLAGLSWLRVPKGLIEVSIFAYRYLFVLLEDAAVIYQSQKVRLGYSGLARSIGSFVTLSGALVLKAFEQSERIASSLIQRGYDGHIPLWKGRSFNPTEVLFSGLFLIAMGGIWIVG
ncbi:MAG: cobalt ECF transporter T component CbiQ [Desulfobacterota bacterium]|nr:cobalt ECF transporter T component CbiQ [Thermodesulfobacteriota bacterium]